jgi:ribonuclease P protein subunit POP4
MPILENNIVRHELIGLRVKVKECPDKTVRGLAGRVVDESYGMLVIEQDDGKNGLKISGEKSVPKRDSIFIFDLPNRTKVSVEGSLLVGRPEDRIRKKLRKW